MNQPDRSSAKPPKPDKPGADSSQQDTILSDMTGSTTGKGAPTAGPSRPNMADSLLTRAPGDRPPARPVSEQTMTTDLHVERGGRSPKVTSGTHQHQIWGDFEIGDLLGRGGMGSVYRGRQVSLDRPVAIKVLPAHLSENENFKQRFQLEARAVAQINSPNVVGVYFAGVHEGHHYFAMEYVEGDDLSRRLKNGYKPSAKETLDLVTQAARGLSAAGDHGIVHRDIKPGNMMVTAKGVVKLMDFGLVRVARAEETGLTMAGTIMGTVSYFSPEQGRGERCDCRTDIYALGVVFYEMLTGRLPFTGGDATSVIYQHIHADPKPPKEINPDIPENYQAVVLKCLQKNPDDRYQTATEMVKDLDALASGLAPITAFLDPKGLRKGGSLVKRDAFSGEKSRAAGWLWAGAATVLAAGGGAIWWYQQNHAAQAPASLAVVPTPASAPVAIQPSRPVTPPDTLVAKVPTKTPDTAPEKPPEAAPVKPSDPIPVPPPAVPVLAPTPGLSDIEQAKLYLQAGNFAECRRLTGLNRQAHPDDQLWVALSAELEQQQGASEVKAGQEALAHGDLAIAGRLAASAASHTPDAPALKALQQQLAEREGALKQRQRLLDEAENLMSEGNAAKAEEMLTKLVAAAPDDNIAEGALRRAKKQRGDQEARAKAVGERLQQGEQALERKDFDAALLHFTAAQQLDPKHPRATAGLDQVTRVKELLTKLRERFESALKQRDLPAAQASLVEMRTLAPGSPTLVLAENEFTNSKLVEDAKAKASADQEAKVKQQAQAVSALIDDPSQGVPALEQALAGFLERAGQDRPERSELERKMEDRRQRLVVVATLAALDGVMARGDRAALAPLVADTDFVQALTELMAYPGLVFESRLDGFTRRDSAATVTVSLRHALAVYPERRLNYVYELKRETKGWTIASAKLQP